VLRSLCATDQIKTRFPDLEIKVEKSGDTTTCFMQGGTRKEQSMFINAVQEVLEPPKNPKYVVAAMKGKKIDLERVYAVPEAIGASKEWAALLLGAMEEGGRRQRSDLHPDEGRPRAHPASEDERRVRRPRGQIRNPEPLAVIISLYFFSVSFFSFLALRIKTNR